MPNPQSVNHDDGVRLQALALAEAGIDTKIITAITEISRQSISRLQKQARTRGYDPSTSKKLYISYVIDQPRSGRPTVVTSEGDYLGEQGGNHLVSLSKEDTYPQASQVRQRV